MRILIFNEFYHPAKKGGAEISCQLLAESLASLGNEVHVACSYEYNKNEKLNGVYVHYMKMNYPYWAFDTHRPLIKKLIWHVLDMDNVFNIPKLKTLIKSVSPDIIHTNNLSSLSCSVWQVAHSLNVPIVHTTRDYYLMCHGTTMYKNGKNCTKQCLACRLSSLYKKQASSYVKGVVGISNFVLEKHLDNGYFKKATIKQVIPNSISIPSNTENLRRTKTIGFMGSITPNKGVEFLISQFLLSYSQDFELHIAGRGDTNYIEFLQSKYSSDRIKFVGRVKPDDFLQSISILVVPSLWEEPFGRVIIEALSNKCPVIVSKHGGMPELVQNDYGRVFDEANNSLSELLNDFTGGRLTFNLHKFSVDEFSRNRVANAYLSVFRQSLH